MPRCRGRSTSTLGNEERRLGIPRDNIGRIFDPRGAAAAGGRDGDGDREWRDRSGSRKYFESFGKGGTNPNPKPTEERTEMPTE